MARQVTITQSTSGQVWTSTGLPAATLDRSQVGIPGGVADLDSNGHLPIGRVPDLSSDYVAVGVQGATIGTTALVNGGPVITVTSPWGVRADGTAYYDPSGAAPGEEALLTYSASGPVLTKIGG
jgi:hypothetical protein